MTAAATRDPLRAAPAGRGYAGNRSRRHEMTSPALLATATTCPQNLVRTSEPADLLTTDPVEPTNSQVRVPVSTGSQRDSSGWRVS
jgi:hypothetical protein